MIGKDLIESRGPSSTSRKPKDKSDRELNKKLEATLSGINLKSRKEEKGSAPAAAKPKEQAAPPVEEKRTPSAEPEQGTPYGNYLLTERVAVGGMAELFKARQKGLEGFQRIVAIKRILPHLASNSDFVTMFIDEAKLAAQLNHPNIVHIYDLGRLEDSYFIAMEYVDGKDLRAVLREVENRGKTFPAKAVVFLALKLCAALHCAHTAKDMDGRPMNLVHRDVSPQNILISTAGEVKLVDFGIAKAATKASHTQSGALKGKLLYMSPEQAWGKPIDARTDIFSTGTVLYEMLTGRKLFQGSSEMSILESVREAVLPDLSGMRNFIPEGLDAILSKALKQDPGERYRDCRSFSHDLEKFAIQQWGSLPTAYDVLAFMTALFPKIYKPEALEALGAEERREEAGVIGDGPADEMVTPAAEESHPKMKAPPVKPAAPPAEVPPPKPPPPAKPAVKPPPPSSKPPTGEEDHGMFKEVMEGSSGGGKKIALIGGIAAVIIAAVLVGLFVMKHSGPAQASPAQGAKNGPAAAAAAGPSPRPAAQPENSTSGASNALPANSPAAQAGEGAATRPAPAAAKASEKAAAAKAAQADRLRKARENAASQIKRFDSAMTEAKAVGASKYAASAMGALNNTKSNIDKLFKSAGSLDDYNLVAKTAREGVVLAGQVKQQALNAKASAQKKQQEEAAAKEAKKQAPEVPKTTAAQGEAPESAKPAAAKSEEKAAPAKPAPPKLKPGDFVPLWKVDVKPKIIKRALPRYSALARQHNVQGTIYVQVTINQTGKATEAKIVKGLKNDFGMNDACLAAALKSRYSPAIKNGIPVTTNLTYSIVLKIE
ncbi:MAG: TonB family protein [Acidobacteriota bacterium]